MIEAGDVFDSEVVEIHTEEVENIVQCPSRNFERQRERVQ